MAAPSEIIVDQYSPLSHKAIVGEPGRAALPILAKSWVPNSERRRLAAYTALAAYLGNVARLLLPPHVQDDQRSEHREYGDPSVLVDRVVAGVLGSDWTITVDGADDQLMDGPAIPDRPEDPGPEADELVKRIYKGRLKAWQTEAEAALLAWEAALEAQPSARTRLADLRTWSDSVQFPARVTEGEHDAVGLGDTVYVLWPTPGGWPTVQVYEPGFYFPERPDDGDRGEFPDVVHLGWEFERERPGPGGTVTVERFVRRVTFELVDLTSERLVDDGNGGATWRGDDGMPVGDDGTVTLPKGDSWSDGRIVRTLPWHVEGDDPATVTCMYSDGEWPLKDVQAGKIDALDESKATWTQPRVDLGIDFVPVVHVPNTPTGKDHYGRSVLDQVAQILDDVAEMDTRIAEGTAFLGKPVIALAGAAVPPDGVIAPGQVYGVGDKGSMNTLDLSAGIEKLMAAQDALHDRLYRNVGIPGDMLGRADAGDIAGITLLLRFAPFAQLVGVLRMAREPKMRLLLKFVQRIAQTGPAPVLEPGPTPVARLQYGNFLPTNRAETIELVAKALQAHAISTHTAVAMLVAAGLPIEDAALEVERIRQENPEAGRAIADALGSEQAAADWMGIDRPETAAPPEIVLP